MANCSWVVGFVLTLASCQRAESLPLDAGHPLPLVRRPPPPSPEYAVTDEKYPAPPLPMAKVVLAGAKGPLTVDVEVAATDASRTRGLMWRWSLAEGKGMLFIFPQTQRLAFWMRNTLIPLDMVFIDEQLTVVGVVEKAEPRTLESRGPATPGKYVLEVPGGYVASHGVKVGSKVALEGVGGITGG